jgi:amino-acid N-acetyltransferase
MELIPRIVNTQQDFELFTHLLRASNLPHRDLNFRDHVLIGYYYGDDLVGTGGLEIYGNYGLLRSLAVKIGARGLSLGSFITKDLIARAAHKNLKRIYLLTETAHGFFQLKGFKDVLRNEVPAEIKSSSEFSNVCPTSAACMFLELN